MNFAYVAFIFNKIYFLFLASFLDSEEFQKEKWLKNITYIQRLKLEDIFQKVLFIRSDKGNTGLITLYY